MSKITRQLNSLLEGISSVDVTEQIISDAINYINELDKSLEQKNSKINAYRDDMNNLKADYLVLFKQKKELEEKAIVDTNFLEATQSVIKRKNDEYEALQKTCKEMDKALSEYKEKVVGLQKDYRGVSLRNVILSKEFQSAVDNNTRLVFKIEELEKKLNGSKSVLNSIYGSKGFTKPDFTHFAAYCEHDAQLTRDFFKKFKEEPPMPNETDWVKITEGKKGRTVSLDDFKKVLEKKNVAERQIKEYERVNKNLREEIKNMGDTNKISGRYDWDDKDDILINKEVYFTIKKENKEYEKINKGLRNEIGILTNSIRAYNEEHKNQVKEYERVNKNLCDLINTRNQEYRFELRKLEDRCNHYSRRLKEAEDLLAVKDLIIARTKALEKSSIVIDSKGITIEGLTGFSSEEWLKIKRMGGMTI